MTTGDPKQAAILGIVAVAAIGFVIFRIIPQGETPRSIATSPRMAQPKDEKTEKAFPTLVLSNAFWHQKISEPKVAKPTIEKPASNGKPGAGTKPVSPFPRMEGTLRPVEIAGNDQQIAGEPTVTVAAIIGSPQRREALIQFGTEELHKAVVGSKFGDLKVIEITETAVKVQIGKAVIRIAVGEEKRL